MARKTTKKPRLPIKQLRAAGKIAKQMLIDRGFRLNEDFISIINKDPNAPKLPGFPEPYLPQRWTIRAAQRMMYDLLKEWMEKTKKDERKQDNAAEFFKFASSVMAEETTKYAKIVKKTSQYVKEVEKGIHEAPILREVFTPLRNLQTIKAMHRFFIDAFAVAVVVKQQDTTTQFVEWFLDWTNNLHDLWSKRDKEEIEAKKK